ncbi:MAG: hypothetical protein ACTH1D_05355 [Mycobacteriaceae bacterium]|uniref:hypothetical protein n=1 Tax=Corynebacterium sp. TaxID=1720 RepID=UPI003F9B39F5
MNARHAPWTDRPGGAAVGDGLASVLRLPLLEAVPPAAVADTANDAVTLLLLAEHHRSPVGYYTRALGLNGELSVAETVRAVLIAFDWPGAPRMLEDADAPGAPTWSLQARRSDRLRVYSRTAGPIGTPVAEALGRDGTATLLVDDVVFTVTTAGAMTRDEHTPDAVCLAGEFIPDATGRRHERSSDFPIPRDVDLAAVNVALTGEETVEEILSGIAPELRRMLLAGDLYEFTPLLQALDLERPAQVPEGVRNTLDRVPAEQTDVGRAAAWARVIALSTLSDRATSDEITEMLMSALGFTRADAGLLPQDGRLSTDPLDAVEIRTLSAASGRILATCGADGWDARGGGESVVTPLVPQCSLVERLEMYRYLLQGHGLE